MVLNLKPFSTNYKLCTTNYKAKGTTYDGRSLHVTVFVQQAFIGSILNLYSLYYTFVCLKSICAEKSPDFDLNPFVVVTFIPFFA